MINAVAARTETGRRARAAMGQQRRTEWLTNQVVLAHSGLAGSIEFGPALAHWSRKSPHFKEAFDYRAGSF
jgi:hypothetical protein